MEVITDVKSGLDLLKKIDPKSLDQIKVYGVLENNTLEEIQLEDILKYLNYPRYFQWKKRLLRIIHFVTISFWLSSYFKKYINLRFLKLYSEFL